MRKTLGEIVSCHPPSLPGAAGDDLDFPCRSVRILLPKRAESS
jgi:hypothetical protein